jgi:ferredoxin-NADP reductase
LQVVFDHAEKVSWRVSTFWFKPERRVRFEPGQFAEFRVPHADVDNRGDTREFSISSLPGEPLIAITTNFARARGSSYKRALRALTPGDKITMAEPMGDFVLPKDPAIPLVFVAAGIGCVPYATMLRWLQARGEQRTIKLIYSASNPNDFLFPELWPSYELDFVPIVTRPTDDRNGRSGRLNATKLLTIVEPLGNKLVYLAGPQSMIEPLFDDLLALGLTRRRLLLDYFSGY